MGAPFNDLECFDLVRIIESPSAGGIGRQPVIAGWFVSACLHASVVYALYSQSDLLIQAPTLSGERRVASVELVASWEADSEALPTTVTIEKVELPVSKQLQPELASSREKLSVQMVSNTRVTVSKFGTQPPPTSTLVRVDSQNPTQPREAIQPPTIEKSVTPAELTQASSQAAAPPQNAGFSDTHWKPQWSPSPYPSKSLILQGLGGRVVLLVSVGTDGRVTSVRLHRSSGHSVFDNAALVSVGRWRYAPPAGTQQKTGATFKQPVVYDPVRAAR